MTLVALVVAAVAGAGLVLALRERWAIAWAVGLAALLAVTLASLRLAPGPVSAGTGAFVVTAYGRLLIGAVAGGGLLLGLAAAASSSPPTVVAGLLAVVVAVAVAVTGPEPLVGVWAIVGGGVAALGAGLLGGTEPVRLGPASAALRVVALGGTAAVLGIAVVAPFGSVPAADAGLIGLAYLAVALGLSLRLAAVPLHGWAARLADTIPAPILAATLAWLPVGLAVVATAWVQGPVAAAGADLGVERGLVLAIGLATIVLGVAAALAHDDLGHVVTYLAIADGGLAVLALSILDPAAWAPARTWLLVLVATKTALVGWLVATEGTFRSRRLPGLEGWARRSPLLGVALALVAIATVGWPGSAVLAARLELADHAIRGPLAAVVAVALFAVLLPYGRMLAIGLRAPAGLVESGPPALPRAPAAWAVADAGPAAQRLRALGRDLEAIWSLDRWLVAAASVIVLASLAGGVAAGAFEARAAAGEPPPAFVEPSPSAEPSPRAEPSVPASAEPSTAASAEPSPSASIDTGRSPTAGPTASPSP